MHRGLVEKYQGLQKFVPATALPSAPDWNAAVIVMVFPHPHRAGEGSPRFMGRQVTFSFGE